MDETKRARDVTCLHDTDQPLWHDYDVAMLDLDGVVYRGGQVVVQAGERLHSLRQHGVRLAFVTNNASRTPAAIAAQLQELGVPASAADVVTSAQAAARLAAGLAPAGGRALVVGGEGLRQALAEHELAALATWAEGPDVVVQGFAPEVGWSLLAEGAYAVAAGVPWVASNRDLTIPTAHGIAPGNGTLVAAIEAATGKRPVLAGKPEPALFDETVLRVGGRRPLVVGDRLDTDIAGANRVGADSLLVLTGVTDLEQLSLAAPGERPTFVAADLAGLEVIHSPVELGERRDGAEAACGHWRVGIASTDVLEVSRLEHAVGPQETTDLLRAVVALAWRRRDTGAGPTEMGDVSDRLHEMMS